jgi:hypothetical protein
MLPTPVLPGSSHLKSAPADAAHGNAESPHGRWKCSACTMTNSEEYVNCTTCMTKRPGKKIDLKEEQKKVKQVAIVNPSFSVRFKALFSKMPPQWKCSACTFINRGIYSQCQSCWYLRVQADHYNNEVASEGKVDEKPKVSSEEQSSSTSTSVFGSIRALFQRSSTNAGQTKGTVGSEAAKEVKEEREGMEERDGEEEMTHGKWKCQQCTLLNPESLEKCSACDFPKNFDMPALGGDQGSVSPHSLGPNEEHGQFDAENDRGPVQLDPEIVLDDVPTPLPVIAAQSPQDPRHHALLSSQGTPTWRCKVCGAFNVINSGLRQCFICGIGVIPECYLPLAPPVRETYRPYSSPQPRLKGNYVSPNHFPQSQARLQPMPDASRPQFQDSVEQDYVNLRQMALWGQAPQQVPNPSRNGSSPSHPLTRVNHLHASSSLSPLHITSSNGGVSPQSEPSYVNANSSGVYPCRSLRHSMDANYRDIPILESENLSHLQLQYTPFRVGDCSHDMEESFVDPYVRPRTPMDYHKTPSPPELLKSSEPQGTNQQDAAAKSHPGRQEKEAEQSRALLEASVVGGHCNRTKCVEERREEDVLRANVVYQEILRYSRTSGEPFTDPDFPPADKSLYSDPSQPVARWQVGKWERPSETRDDFDSQRIEWTVLREARPEDIAQGVLGNCWVLSALGVIAEQPQLIEDILITKQYCPEVGAYQVRLCRDGRWEVVVVDNCFPCLNTGELVFSKVC